MIGTTSFDAGVDGGVAASGVGTGSGVGVGVFAVSSLTIVISTQLRKIYMFMDTLQLTNAQHYQRRNLSHCCGVAFRKY